MKFEASLVTRKRVWEWGFASIPLTDLEEEQDDSEPVVVELTSQTARMVGFTPNDEEDEEEDEDADSLRR